jgi:hypothetical protein
VIRDLLRIARGQIAAVSALLLANLAIFVAVLRPEAERVLDGEARLPRLEARLARLELEEQARRLMGESRAQAEVYAASFPPRAELLAVTDRLQRVAGRFDVAVPTIQYRPEARPAEGAPLTRLTIAMSVEGSYRELRRLIHQLEHDRHHVVIEKAVLRRRAGGERVQLDLELAAYFR